MFLVLTSPTKIILEFICEENTHTHTHTYTHTPPTTTTANNKILSGSLPKADSIHNKFV